MADTNFIDRATSIQASWLNDVNDTIYSLPTNTGSALVGHIASGTGAVATTVGGRLRQEALNFVGDFGGVVDGTFVPGGSASGTDNLAKINIALAVCTQLQKPLYITGGQFYFSGGFTIPAGVKVFGDGNQFTSYFLDPAKPKTGTVLLINGAAGADCVKYAEQGFNTALEDCSVFNTNTNAIRSVVRIAGQLHPKLRRVTLNSLRPTPGVGLLLETADVAGIYYETLYGDIEQPECTAYNIGGATEASVHTGLKIISRSSGKRVNAIRFLGGAFSGKKYAYDISSLVAATGPINLTFFGTLFEGVYSTTMDHVYLPDSLRLLDYSQSSSYVVKHGLITNVEKPNFNGCYFELGSTPATYDDGTNGVANLVGAVWLDNATGVKNAKFDGCVLNSVYLYDNGNSTEITPLASGYRYDTTRATSVTVRKNAAQTIPAYVWTKVQFPATAPFRGGDNQLVWDTTNHQATCRSKGTYLISANLVFSPGWTTGGTYVHCRVVFGSNQMNGSVGRPASAAEIISTSLTAPIDLNVGDVVWLETIQTQGADQTLSASAANCHFSITKIA